jgi:hypothetical protein
MKYQLILLLVLSVFCSTKSVAAPYIQDVGKIENLYLSANGNIAIQLENGYPNATSDGQCSTANLNSFGGNLTADPAFKSALLAAKAAQQTITVTVQGCEAGGAWFKIIDVYVN